MATATKTGFKVTCPFCRDEDATVSIDLADVNACTCSGCSEEFTVDTARKMAAAELARWEAVAAWVAMAPTTK